MKKTILILIVLAMASVGLGGDLRDKLNVIINRDTVAYIDTESGIDNVAIDNLRTRTVAVCSVSDGELRATDTITAVTDVSIRPLAVTDGYIWGHNATTQKLYRSADGDTWEVFDDATSTTSLLTTSTGRLLWFRSAGAAFKYQDRVDAGDTNDVFVWYELYYSDNPDAITPTWTQATDGTNPYYFGGLPVDWSLKEARGTIIAAEYGSALYHRAFINRSVDDGATWSVVHYQEKTTISHYHAVGYHAGTDKWVCNTGDGAGQQFLLTSTDDGLTWASHIVGKQDNAGQVIRYMDYGDATKILCASDDIGMVHGLDLTTYNIYPSLTNWENQIGGSKSNFCTELFKYGNVYYACQWDGRYPTSTYPRHAVISVSTDLVNWTVYHRFTDIDIKGVRGFGGYFNGKLHFAVEADVATTVYHLLLSPATVSNVSGLVIEPAATQMLSESQSSIETGLISVWTELVNIDTAEVVSGTAYHGTKSAHFLDNDGYIQPGIVFNTDVNDYYIGRAWIKGQTNGTGSFHLNTYNGNTNDRPKYLFGSEWKEYATEVRQATAITTAISVFGNLRPSDSIVELWVDAIAVYKFPCPFWNLGDATKNKDEYTYTVWAGEDAAYLRRIGASYNPTYWTDDFTINPHIGSHKITAYTGKMYLRTYKADANNYASVYYKADDGKFYLEVVVAGAAATTQATAATAFLSDASIYIKIVKDVSGLTLSVASGVAYISATAITAPDNLWGELTVIEGDINTDNIFPHTLSFDTKLSTTINSINHHGRSL